MFEWTWFAQNCFIGLISKKKKKKKKEKKRKKNKGRKRDKVSKLNESTSSFAWEWRYWARLFGLNQRTETLLSALSTRHFIALILLHHESCGELTERRKLCFLFYNAQTVWTSINCRNQQKLVYIYPSPSLEMSQCITVLHHKLVVTKSARLRCTRNLCPESDQTS